MNPGLTTFGLAMAVTFTVIAAALFAAGIYQLSQIGQKRDADIFAFSLIGGGVFVAIVPAIMWSYA